MADGPAPTPAPARPAKRSRSSRLAGLVNDRFVSSVLTGLAGLVVAVLTTTLTPLGEDLRERVSPTAAVVEGAVYKGQLPVARAEVVLDGRHRTRTASMGEFLFDGVGAGLHTLQIVEGGALVYERAFAVDRRGVRVVIGQTDLAVAVPIPAQPAEAAPPTAPPEPGGADPQVSGEEGGGGGGGGSPAASPVLGPVATRAPTVVGLPTAAGGAIPTPVPTAATGQPPGRTPPAPASPAATPRAAATATPTPATTPSPAPTATTTPTAAAPSPTPAPTPEATLAAEPSLAVQVTAAPGGGPLATVRLAASDAVLAGVARVTYRLPEGFNPSIVTRYSPADGFALAFVPAEGETVVAATVFFADGRTLDLTATVRA